MCQSLWNLGYKADVRKGVSVEYLANSTPHKTKEQAHRLPIHSKTECKKRNRVFIREIPYEHSIWSE